MDWTEEQDTRLEGEPYPSDPGSTCRSCHSLYAPRIRRRRFGDERSSAALSRGSHPQRYTKLVVHLMTVIR